MDAFTNGLAEAWATIARIVPQLIAFLLILVVGYFVVKAIEKALDAVLERVGFDKAVERGGVKKALSKSKYDASSLLAKVVFYAGMLFVLQLAFGIFGENPASELIQGVIAYLPNVFAAVLIVVLGAAIAAGVKDVISAALGGLSYGKNLAVAASVAILVIAVFAALDQLQIAPTIVNTLFIAMVVTIAGSTIIAVGGGGIRTMQQYWDRTAQKLEKESDNVSKAADGAGERVKERAETRKEQAQQQTASVGSGSGSGDTARVPQYGSGSDRQ